MYRTGLDTEALSGLARAFFYAGVRVLLVSHWSAPLQSLRKASTTKAFRLIDRRLQLRRT